MYHIYLRPTSVIPTCERMAASGKEALTQASKIWNLEPGAFAIDTVTGKKTVLGEAKKK